MKDIKTDNVEVKRIDPLKTVVSRDLLTMAMELYRLKPNREYWANVPVPTRPNGQVSYESARQVGVFALPVALYVVAAQVFGYGHALFGLPLYYGVMRLLERALTKAIISKREKEEDLDRGRYAFTKILGERLGLKPEEVTLDVVLKMTADFGILVIYGRNLPEDAKNEFMRRAYQLTDMDARLDFIWAYFEETKHLAPVVKKPETRKGARRTGAAAATSYAGGNSSGGNAYDDEDEPAYPTVNPTSGLPMVNNIIDVGGNAYGQGNFGEL